MSFDLSGFRDDEKASRKKRSEHEIDTLFKRQDNKCADYEKKFGT